MNNKVCYLLAHSWEGLSLGAIHWRGTLICDNKSHKLTRTVTRKDIIHERKWAHYRGEKIQLPLEIGFTTDQWWSEDDIIKESIEKYKIIFPSARILLLGSSSIASVQKALDGPIELIDRINKLYYKADSLSWYEKRYNQDEMNLIDDENWKILTEEILKYE